MNITGRNDIYKDHYVIDNIKMQWIGSRDAMHRVSTVNSVSTKYDHKTIIYNHV